MVSLINQIDEQIFKKHDWSKPLFNNNLMPMLLMINRMDSDFKSRIEREFYQGYTIENGKENDFSENLIDEAILDEIIKSM